MEKHLKLLPPPVADFPNVPSEFAHVVLVPLARQMPPIAGGAVIRTEIFGGIVSTLQPMVAGGIGCVFARIGVFVAGVCVVLV